MGLIFCAMDESKEFWKWLLILVAMIAVIFVAAVVYDELSRPKMPELTPEELHQRDSIRQAYRKEQDSIKRAQEEAHEEYIRKMARDIVNPGKGNKKRSNNMRGWDPASENDLEENGMDRYMENDVETGWD